MTHSLRIEVRFDRLTHSGAYPAGALFAALGLKVIAEGVETDEQRQILETMACDEGQGYYWNRPMPAGEFAARYGPTGPDVTKYQTEVTIG